MSLGGKDTIHISYQELVRTKRFLENQPKLPKATPPDQRCGRVPNEETTQLVTTSKPSDNACDRNASSRSEKSHSYPSNHGMLRIPKEVDKILRRDARSANRTTSSQSWERFRVCGMQLGDIVRRNSGPLMYSVINRATDISKEMRELTAVIIQSDLEFCAEHSVETELWQKGIYALIEPLRENARKFTGSRREYLSYLQTTEHFYSSLISSVQSSYAFSLGILDTIRNVECRDRQRKVTRAALSCHFAYLALGDILRYQLIMPTADPNLCVETDWSMVESHYLHAMHLAPNKGRSYNQLAIVSSTQVRYLDAVYYYVRCLTAVDPIPSVRESLIQIFYSVDKKNLESLKKEIRAQNKAKVQKYQIENEVWIIPDSLMKPVSRPEQRPEYSDSPLVARKTISPGTLHKLYKEVYLSFLNIQSKYFTSIGIDTVSDWVSRFDSAFSSLMKSRCNQSLAEILLKMQLVVLFSLTNNTASKSVQLSKLDFLFTFHSHIFQSFLNQLQNENGVSAWFLLPHIRIFTQWLRHYKDTWEDHTATFHKHRIWPNLFPLLNQLIQYRGDKTPVSSAFLWEDQFLSGCVLMERFIQARMSWRCLTIDPEDDASKELRISIILSEMENLCSQTGIPVRFYGGAFTLESGSDLEKDSDPELSPKTPNSESDSIEDDIFDESEFISDDEEILCVQSQDADQRDYIILKTEKVRLEAEVNKQTSELKNTHSIISNKLNRAAFQRHEISPRYIVPDTNCYLSSLHLLQKLYLHSNLQLTVPLIVLQELEQLRIPYSTSPKHKSSSLKAKDAFTWLRQEFASSDMKLLALTIQGNLVSNPLYQQDFSSVKNQRNDDLILQACVKLNSQKEEECLKSNVVLVTSDRNLRLKAQSFCLPAKSLTRFLCILDIKI